MAPTSSRPRSTPGANRWRQQSQPAHARGRRHGVGDAGRAHASGIVRVSESGLKTAADLRRLRRLGLRRVSDWRTVHDGTAIPAGTTRCSSAASPQRTRRTQRSRREDPSPCPAGMRVSCRHVREDLRHHADGGRRRSRRGGRVALGFVFWPKSPRFVDPYRARAIAASLPPFVVPVGVFVNQPADVRQRRRRARQARRRAAARRRGPCRTRRASRARSSKP